MRIVLNVSRLGECLHKVVSNVKLYEGERGGADVASG